jgi:hypothetical protein
MLNTAGFSQSRGSLSVKGTPSYLLYFLHAVNDSNVIRMKIVTLFIMAGFVAEIKLIKFDFKSNQ